MDVQITPELDITPVNSHLPVPDCEHGTETDPGVFPRQASHCSWATPPVAVIETWIDRPHRPATTPASNPPELRAITVQNSNSPPPGEEMQHAAGLPRRALCSLCRGYVERGKDWPPDPSISYGTVGVAQPGCALCWIFLRGAQAAGGSLTYSKSSGSDAYVFGRCKWNAQYFYALLESKRCRTVLETNFYCTPDLPCPWRVFPSHQDIFALNHPRSFARMSDWLKDCSETHPTCRAQAESHEPPVLPTRILDIGDSHGDLRLVEPAGTRGRYACLSHRWGTLQPLQTTKSCLKDHLKKVSWALMPRTFRDAISVTRYLGLHYIWIDSLCIVQDDEADWRREAARMASIYASGYVTIAATSSTTAASGMLSDSGNILAHVLGEHGGPDQDKAYHVRIRSEIRHPVMQGHHEGSRSTEVGYVSDIDHWPLLRRGWVFQERLLSARVLHLSRPEMIWECNEEIKCECGNMNAVENQKRSFWRNVSSLQSPDHNAGSAGKHSDAGVAEDYWADDFHRLWWHIVRSYTGHDLTYQSDKLPALSGIVKILMSSRPCAEYVAGLWTDQLLYDLLWTTSTGSSLRGYDKGSPAIDRFVSPRLLVDWRDPARITLSRRRTLHSVGEPELPSWSWASRAQEHILHSFQPTKEIHGPSKTQGKHTDTLCTVEGIQGSYVSSDSTLGDNGSSLTLRGSLNRIVFGENMDQPPGNNPRRPGSGRRYLYEEMYPEPPNPILHDKSTNGRSSTHDFQALLVHSINAEEEPCTPLMTKITVTFDSHVNYLGHRPPLAPPSEVGFYCLPVASMKGWYQSHVKSARLGLALQALDTERSVFRRIGLVREEVEELVMPQPRGLGDEESMHFEKVLSNAHQKLESHWRHHNMFLSTNKPPEVITLI